MSTINNTINTMDKSNQPRNDVRKFVVTYKLDINNSATEQSEQGDFSLTFYSVEAVMKNDQRLNGNDTVKELMERRRYLIVRANREIEDPSISGAGDRVWKNYGLIRKDQRGDLEAKSDHVPIIVFAEYEESVDWVIQEGDQVTKKNFRVTVTGDPVMDKRALNPKNIEALTAKQYSLRQSALSKASIPTNGIQPPDYSPLFKASAGEGTGRVTLGDAQPGAQFFSFYKYHIQLLEDPWTSFDPCIVCGTPASGPV